MFILVFIFITFMFFQLIVGIYSIRNSFLLKQRYAYPLSDSTEASKTLELYAKIYRTVNLKVNAAIEQPAVALNEYILINKEYVYNTDLYTNFYLIFQLELTKSKYKYLRSYYIWQNLLFMLQNILFVVGLAFGYEYGQYLLVFAIAIAVGLILFSIISYLEYSFMLNEVEEIAKDLLNLDKVEQARAESLKYQLPYTAFEYPFETFWRLVQFLKP